MSQEKEISVKYPVRIAPEGYQEIYPKPSPSDLAAFYNNQYFNVGSYSQSYSEEELFNKNLFFAEAEHITGLTHGSVLDVGCGEGFSLEYFRLKGWDTFGVDFTDDGVRRHYPHLLEKLEVGDILSILEKIIESGKHFDLIICNNVLEHVIDPDRLLSLIAALMGPKTVCRIQVPNDNSWLQNEIVTKGLANNNYWVCPPGHLTYFNTDNLVPFLDKHGLEVTALLGDFPIELFLLNRASNYKLNPSAGRTAHEARTAFDNLLAKRSINDLVAFRRTCGQIGLCRNMAAYCKRKT